jgi:aldose 1-epimerase
MNTVESDAEITLRYSDFVATVAPFGASLRGLTYEGISVVTGYSGKANKVGGQGDVLIPFPGRVKGGRYIWDGVTYEMPLTDKDGPNAIHGFVRLVDWQVTRQTESKATFQLDFAGAEGYPFPLSLSVTYMLTVTGLTCVFEVQNVGTMDAPVSVGFHPYFTVGADNLGQIDTDILTLPFSSLLEMEELIPTGRVRPVSEAHLDFRDPRPIDSTKFNSCFLHPIRDENGNVTVTLQSENRKIGVWMDESFGSVVLYSGDPLPDSHRRKSLAIEPMTGGSDSFNHPEFGLHRLRPGGIFTGKWGVTVK